jgi:two-component system nitrogen regulation response regulator GlnG
MAHLLFIDDEQSICWGLKKLAQRMGHSSDAVGSAELGLRSAATSRPDAIVMDVRMPGMSGLDAIEKLQAIVPDAPVVIITAYGDLETASATGRTDDYTQPGRRQGKNQCRASVRNH